MLVERDFYFLPKPVLFKKEKKDKKKRKRKQSERGERRRKRNKREPMKIEFHHGHSRRSKRYPEEGRRQNLYQRRGCVMKS